MAKRRNNAQRWSPQDLPYQVDLFIESTPHVVPYIGEDMPWEQRFPPGSAPIDPNDVYHFVDDIHHELVAHDLKTSSNIMWMTSDLVDLVKATSDTMPAWTPRQTITDDGFIAFAQPLTFIEGLPIDALAWTTYTPLAEGGGDFLVLGLSRTIHDRIPDSYTHRGPFITLKIYDSTADKTYQPPSSDVDSTAEFARLLGTALLLANQPDIVTELTDESVTLPAKRRPLCRSTPDKHKTQLPDVKVRYLTVLPRVREDVDASEAEHAGLQRGALTQRHWVRGHWRQQPCGPGRTQIKPVYIKPHLRGPDHAPIDERPGVDHLGL